MAHIGVLRVLDSLGIRPDLVVGSSMGAIVGGMYASGYTDPQLGWWAARIREWRVGGAPGDATCVVPPAPDRRGGRDVYVYFDNDAKGFAPHDAMALIDRVGRP